MAVVTTDETYGPDGALILRRVLNDDGSVEVTDENGTTVEAPTAETIDAATRILARQTAEQNASTLEDRIRQELANNKTFLDIANPTNAQNATQLKNLTRQVNALFRFQLGEFDDISDT